MRNLLSMYNLNLLDPLLPTITQGIVCLGTNETCQGNCVITISLEQSRLYTLMSNPHNTLIRGQHINNMVIPGLFIFQDLLMSKLGWTSKSVWCHDKMRDIIEPGRVTLKIIPLRCVMQPLILLRYQMTLKIHQNVIQMFADTALRNNLEGGL